MLAVKVLITPSHLQTNDNKKISTFPFYKQSEINWLKKSETNKISR